MAAKKSTFTPQSARRVAAATIEVEKSIRDVRGRRRNARQKVLEFDKSFRIAYIDKANSKVYVNSGYITMANETPYHYDPSANGLVEITLTNGGSAGSPKYVGIGVPYDDITTAALLTISTSFHVSNNTQYKKTLFGYHMDNTASPKVLVVVKVHHEGTIDVPAFRLGAVA